MVPSGQRVTAVSYDQTVSNISRLPPRELLPILDICHKKGVKVITITENLESPLALGADVVIKQFVTKECDRYNSQGTTSSTALCMIIHALQTALLEETNFQIEQFAITHPGGAVGERLNDKAIF